MPAPLTPGAMPDGMPIFNPNPSTGLQPLLIALLYLFPGIAGLVVAVRIIKKRADRTLGGGKCADLCWRKDVELTITDDVLIVLGWVLALGNSVIVHLCKDYGRQVQVALLTRYRCIGDARWIPRPRCELHGD
jgi:hypothetical protein